MVLALMLLSVVAVAGATEVERQDLTEAEARAVYRGIDKVAVAVVGADGDDREARLCALSSDELRLSAARPLLDGGIEVLPQEIPALAEPVVVVSIAALRLGSSCAVFAETQVLAGGRIKFGHQVTFTPDLNEPPEVALRHAVLIFQSGKIFSGPGADFGSRINTFVREQVDQFVTRVKLANQK
jgi:hypothetical protein